MLNAILTRSASLLPGAPLEQARWLSGAVGAAIAIGLSALLTQFLLGQNSVGMPWLIAPLGASAVLVFAVPASPLAQPWPVIGGNLISAMIGLGLGIFISSPWIACSLAVGLSLWVMTYSRCLHPPGGASALLCALGATGPDAWSWPYLLPITANVLTLSVVGWAYNNFTGHPWPHRGELAPRNPSARSAQHTRAEIEELLTEWDEVLDVDVNDLDAFYLALERKVANRLRSP